VVPSDILFNCNPVTPLAGILYKPPPLPLKLPVNEPVVYDDVNSPNDDVKVYFSACDAEIALDVVPLMEAFITPSTVKLPAI
jgi:hypothetical protein